MGIFGGSYGGYATLAGLAFTPERYAAGASFVGPSNLITLLESIPPYWAPLRAMFNQRVGDPEDPSDRARLEAQSPLFSADQIQAPLLVIQGANDPRVKQAESDQIVVALRELNRPVEYLIAPDEGHGFIRETNLLAGMAALERFLAEHLGGRYQAGMSPDVEAQLDALTVDVDTVTVNIQDEPNVADIDPAVYSRYIGIYQLLPEMQVQIRVEDEQLIAQADGQDALILYPTSETEFFTKIGNISVQFKVSPEGTVSGFTLNQLGQELFASKLD